MRGRTEIPRRCSPLLALLLAASAPFAEAESAEELGWWTGRTLIEVAGERRGSVLAPAYQLSVRFEAGVGTRPFEALRIYAEPGHSLLFEQVDPAMQRGRSAGPESASALASLEGELGHLTHRLILPFEPERHPATRIVVELTWAGRPVVVADAWVDLWNFHVATRFRQGNRGADDLQTIEHCCRGRRCDWICATCSGPGFFCDLGTCEIECIDF